MKRAVIVLRKSPFILFGLFLFSIGVFVLTVINRPYLEPDSKKVDLPISKKIPEQNIKYNPIEIKGLEKESLSWRKFFSVNDDLGAVTLSVTTNENLGTWKVKAYYLKEYPSVSIKTTEKQGSPFEDASVWFMPASGKFHFKFNKVDKNSFSIIPQRSLGDFFNISFTLLFGFFFVGVGCMLMITIVGEIRQEQALK